MAKNAVTKTNGAGLPAAFDMEADAGAGFENVSAEDFSIPFIALLQKGSPQCDVDSDSYIEGVKPGMFWDSGAQQILEAGGKPAETIKVTPIHYDRKFVQWRDREDGGGFVAAHDAGADVVKQARRDDRGRFQLPDGTHLADTRQFFVMLWDADMATARPALISMTSTQIRTARQWMTRMSDFKVQGKGGRFTPPMFGQIWELGSVAQSNASGTWRGWRIGEPQLVTEPEVYQAAKDMRDAILSGAVSTGAPPQGTGAGDTATSAPGAPLEGDDVPF